MDKAYWTESRRLMVPRLSMGIQVMAGVTAGLSAD
ncbi:hypothetical protein NKDENANG_00615 [Candidatus Entotheonellaceae bacterium PAL068K]